MRRSTNLAILLVSIILGAVAAFLARSWLQSHTARVDADQTASIVVANRALAFGIPIAADDVREIAWPAKSRPQGAFANFAELAKTAGIHGIRVEDPADVKPALVEAFKHDGPALVDVVVNRMELSMPPTIKLEQAIGFN